MKGFVGVGSDSSSGGGSGGARRGLRLVLASAAAPGSVSFLVFSTVSESDAKRRAADPNRRSSAEDADASAAERCSARAAARSRRLFFSEPRDAASLRGGARGAAASGGFEPDASVEPNPSNPGSNGSDGSNEPN